MRRTIGNARKLAPRRLPKAVATFGNGLRRPAFSRGVEGTLDPISEPHLSWGHPTGGGRTFHAMPYLICPACRLEAYSAAGYATSDRCPRCDTSLRDAQRADGILHRWKVTYPDLAVDKEADHAAD